MFDRRLAQCFDWGLLGIVALIGGVGLMTLYSAVTSGTANPYATLFLKQTVWYCVGFVLMIGAFLFSYKYFEQWGNLIYGACIVLLLWVEWFGKYVGGSRRWLEIGPASLQPSELVKLGVIIILARYYAKMVNTRGLSLRELIRPMILTLIPFVIIVRQPDLGTGMVIVLIALSITVFVKIQRRALMYIISGCTVAVPLVWFFLKGYQKRRILTFLDPERDPLGAGYHIIQSKIAIGSGMLSGKGYLKGTQNALDFLPEQHTDFIFSVLAEEWGLVGSGMLLVLFFLLILWGLNIAQSCRDPFGTILSVGATAMIFWQVVINIGMVMGLMPVVGVTLPFISYGGSSIITVMIAIGLLMNVSMRRYMFE
jgi:rod shape determining protein RodA